MSLLGGGAAVVASLLAGGLAGAAAFAGAAGRRALLLERLPGLDCGACGFATCAEHADRILAGGDALVPCFPLLGAGGLEALEADFSVRFRRPAPRVARILCGGGPDRCPPVAEAQNYADCRAAAAGAPLRRCAVGCLGFGSCAAACPSGAMSMRDGLPRVDETRCTGCGLCARECPHGLVALLPRESHFVVACVNEEKAARVHQICSVGCLACHVCVKVCPADAVRKLENRVAIDPAACVNCGLCALKCPTDAIASFRRAPRFAAIDPERCNGCGACRAKCPVAAITGEEARPHVVDEARCIGCGLCFAACPRDAIRPKVIE